MKKSEDKVLTLMGMTPERFLEVADRIYAKLNKRVLATKKKYYKDQNKKNSAAFLAAAEEFYTYDRIVRLCDLLGKQIVELREDGSFPHPIKITKKEDLN